MNAAPLDGETDGLFGVTAVTGDRLLIMMFAPVTFAELIDIPEILPAGFDSFGAPVF
jgi:hypothetical protein